VPASSPPVAVPLLTSSGEEGGFGLPLGPAR
jgi:hypothetical protein